MQRINAINFVVKKLTENGFSAVTSFNIASQVGYWTLNTDVCCGSPTLATVPPEGPVGSTDGFVVDYSTPGFTSNEMVTDSSTQDDGLQGKCEDQFDN